MANTVITGVGVTVALSGTAVLGERNATLTLKADMIPTWTKASTDTARTFAGGFYEWSLKCDGMAYSGSAPASGAAAVATLAIARAALACVVTVGADSFTGNIIIADWELNAPGEEESTYSMTLQGTGALTPASG